MSPFLIKTTIFLLAEIILASPLSVQQQQACNNSPLLCSKPYDEISHLGAHDSAFLRDVADGDSSFGDQFFNVSTQLSAGVRLVSAQVYPASNKVTGVQEPHLCHTSCSLFDAGPLADWLQEIGAWMDANPNEVVTVLLVNPNGISAAELQGQYSKAGIARYGWTPSNPSAAPGPSNETHHTWPTLQDMIDQNKRLVSFVQPLKLDEANAPYLLDEFTFIWENNYQVSDPSNFTCTPNRPHPDSFSNALNSGKLFLMNHMLYWQQAFNIQVPDIRNIYATNSWDGAGGLGTHLKECAQMYTKQPTFVFADFFNVGPAVLSVDHMNGVNAPVGRTNLTAQIVGGGAGVEEVVGGVDRRRISLGLLTASICLVIFWLWA